MYKDTKIKAFVQDKDANNSQQKLFFSHSLSSLFQGMAHP